MHSLNGYCSTCQTDVEVFGYWEGHDEDGRDQWELVEPPDVVNPDHYDHDVSVTGVL